MLCFYFIFYKFFSNNVDYETEDMHEASINSILSCSSDLTIKGSVIFDTAVMKITKINKNAFGQCKPTNVKLPDTIVSIGDSLFKNCESLISINIPLLIKTIPESCFENCYNLRTVKLSSLTQEIQRNAFKHCYSLNNIDLSSISYIGPYAFSFCSNLTSISIMKPDSSIFERAFYNCTSLNKVTCIDYSIFKSPEIFSGCKNLTGFSSSINISGYIYDIYNTKYASLTDIPDFDQKIKYPNNTVIISYLFDKLPQKGLTISQFVSYVNPELFRKIDSNYKIKIDKNNPKYKIKASIITYNDRIIKVMNSTFNSMKLSSSIRVICENSFSYSNLSFLITSKNLHRIEQYSFYRSSISSIQLSEKLQIIDSYAFYQSNLSSIYLPRSVLFVGHHSFAGCPNLNSIQVNCSNSIVENSLFDSCRSLKVVYYDCSVVPCSCFLNCERLSFVYLDNNVKLVERDSFRSCTSLETVRIGNSLSEIKENAFYSCSSLISMEIPQSIRKIGENAFYGTKFLTLRFIVTKKYKFRYICKNFIELVRLENATAIESFDVQESIIGFGNRSISNNFYLTEANIPIGVKYLGDECFANCSSLKTVLLPHTLKIIGKNCFLHCNNLKEISIPESIYEIGEFAFRNCSLLSRIFYCSDFDVEISHPLVFNTSTLIHVSKNYQGTTLCGYKVIQEKNMRCKFTKAAVNVWKKRFMLLLYVIIVVSFAAIAFGAIFQNKIPKNQNTVGNTNNDTQFNDQILNLNDIKDVLD